MNWGWNELKLRGDDDEMEAEIEKMNRWTQDAAVGKKWGRSGELKVEKQERRRKKVKNLLGDGNKKWDNEMRWMKTQGKDVGSGGREVGN